MLTVSVPSWSDSREKTLCDVVASVPIEHQVFLEVDVRHLGRAFAHLQVLPDFLECLGIAKVAERPRFLG